MILDNTANAPIEPVVPNLTTTPNSPNSQSANSSIKRKRKRNSTQLTSNSPVTTLDESLRSTLSPSSSTKSPNATGSMNTRSSLPNTPYVRVDGSLNAPYVYGAAFTHSSRTRRPNISEDDGMFILSHVIREFDKLPLNVSVKKLPMTFWHRPLESWNRRLVQKQLPPASSEETVRTFYYNNLKTYRGICNMLRIPEWSFNEKTMELTPPPDVDRDELYTPEGKKVRGLLKRFPYMKHFRILEILIENRDQGTVKDLDAIMAEIGVENPSELDYDNEVSIDASNQQVQTDTQKNYSINASIDHTESNNQDLQRQTGNALDYENSAHEDHINTQHNSSTTEKATPQSAKSLQLNSTDNELQPAQSISPSSVSTQSNLINYTDGQSKRKRSTHTRDISTSMIPLQNSMHLTNNYPEEGAFSPAQPSSSSGFMGAASGIPLHQNYRGSSQGMPLPPPSQLIGSSIHSSSQTTPQNASSAIINTTSSSILQPRPTIFSSFVLHAKARLQDSNDLSIVLRALFASDARYLLYQVVRDSTSVAAEAARAEGRGSIAPDHMDEILLLVLEISREIARENNWQPSDSQRPLTTALSAVSSSSSSTELADGNLEKSQGINEQIAGLDSAEEYYKHNGFSPAMGQLHKKKKASEAIDDPETAVKYGITEMMELNKPGDQSKGGLAKNNKAGFNFQLDKPSTTNVTKENKILGEDNKETAVPRVENYSTVHVNNDMDNGITRTTLGNEEEQDKMYSSDGEEEKREKKMSETNEYVSSKPSKKYDQQYDGSITSNFSFPKAHAQPASTSIEKDDQSVKTKPKQKGKF